MPPRKITRQPDRRKRLSHVGQALPPASAALPLEVEMTAWEYALNALVLAPLAITMFVGAMPLLVVNAFSRKPVPAGVTA